METPIGSLWTGNITGVAHAVSKAISRLYMNPTCNVNKDILKGLDKNDYIHSQHKHLSWVCTQTFQENIDLCTSVGESFANISDAVEDVAFPTMTEFKGWHCFITVWVNITV